MNYRNVLPGGRRAQLFSALEPHFDRLFDFLFQLHGDEEAAVDTLQAVLRHATRKFPHERYERYLALWIFRLAVEIASKRYANFVSERADPKTVPFYFLSLEEKLALLLRDRLKFEFKEIAAMMQIPEGRVGRLLAYAREKTGERIIGSDWREKLKDSSDCNLLNMTERVSWNQVYGTEKQNRQHETPAHEAYEQQVAAAVKNVTDLTARRFVEIESSIRRSRLMPLLLEPKSFRWGELSWKTKIGMEGVALAAVGILALVVFPWIVERIDEDAIREHRYTQIFRLKGESAVSQEISADRLLASAEEENAADRDLATINTSSGDEFAEVEFPSGDFYESGAAPLAPSRQSAAIFRVIVQSSSPKDLISPIREVFQKKKVKERESSGKLMPGGVFFDGLTDVGTYPEILKEIEGLKLGKTRPFPNPGPNRSPSSQARVIVWIQQI
jgi:DNA-directed RNA polymerase specialized sigma24 family protein